VHTLYIIRFVTDLKNAVSRRRKTISHDNIIFILFSRFVRMSADADPRRDLPAHAKHATCHVRSVEQCDFKTTCEVYRTISDHHRRVSYATLRSTNEYYTLPDFAYQ